MYWERISLKNLGGQKADQGEWIRIYENGQYLTTGRFKGFVCNKVPRNKNILTIKKHSGEMDICTQGITKIQIRRF